MRTLCCDDMMNSAASSSHDDDDNNDFGYLLFEDAVTCDEGDVAVVTHHSNDINANNNHPNYEYDYVPVGGLRRVSSCYFSLAESHHGLSHQSLSTLCADAAIDGYSDNATTEDNDENLDILLRLLFHNDIFMNVLLYLDVTELANFSLTTKRYNYECFHFLELQLQRATLLGIETSRHQQCKYDDASNNSQPMILPTFEGAIAGTGVITRLAAMDAQSARSIVQTYLDSNVSIRAMPLQHSLAYLKQMLSSSSSSNNSNSKSARNMALLFTLLGAAYRVHQSGSVGGGECDTTAILNEENIDVIKNVMIKVGLAGGFLKAGLMKSTMKETMETTEEEAEEEEGGAALARENDDDVGAITTLTSRQRRHGRSTSLGSLEDLTNRIPNPSAIAAMLYNAFHKGYNNAVECEASVADPQFATSPKRLHRSKRSHNTLHHQVHDSLEGIDHIQQSSRLGAEVSSVISDANSKRFVEESRNDDVEMDEQKSSHECITYNATNNVSLTINHATKEDGGVSNTFSSSRSPDHKDKEDSLIDTLNDDNNVPTGCVGAYARAVENAVNKVTLLVKEERRANFEKLSNEEQIGLGQQFIDACTSDERLHIVKELTYQIDVDRFFIGPDDTETCGLHAASFNGAEQVLKFLCGGIDERDPNSDGGLCDVNVRDANGWTALHFAAGANSVSSVIVLAKHGAKLTLEATNGYTPFHWAERLSNVEVAAQLEKLGADNRFVGRWIGFGVSSFLTNQFFTFGRYNT